MMDVGEVNTELRFRVRGIHYFEFFFKKNSKLLFDLKQY